MAPHPSRRARTSPHLPVTYHLSAQTHLLFDRASRVVGVLRPQGTQLLPSGPMVRLTPSAALILEALLRAYPHHASYATLCTALYPAIAASVARDRSISLRPIRRALRVLSPALRELGLEVMALRGRGYQLALVPGDALRDAL